MNFGVLIWYKIKPEYVIINNLKVVCKRNLKYSLSIEQSLDFYGYVLPTIRSVCCFKKKFQARSNGYHSKVSRLFFILLHHPLFPPSLDFYSLSAFQKHSLGLYFYFLLKLPNTKTMHLHTQWNIYLLWNLKKNKR